jgi:hypothetical protein
MLRYIWTALYTIIAILPTTSWALCYYLIDQGGNVQSSVYPPYDLSYPVDQLTPAERAQRAQRGHLIIGDRTPTCSRTPFSPPKVPKVQPVDSNKKIDNTTTTQNAPPLKKPLTPAEIQEATKPSANVATTPIATPPKTEPVVETKQPQNIKENQQLTTRPDSKPLPKSEEKPKETVVEKTEQPTTVPAVTQSKEPPLAATKESVKETVVEKTEKAEQPAEKLAEKPVEKSIKITENMALQAIQSIDESLSKRDLKTYRKLLAPSLEVGELKGGGKSTMKIITAEAYSKQLEKAFSNIAGYEVKHHNPKITIDHEKSQATVSSEVHVRLEFQDALETNRTYGENTTFNLINDKLLLSRLAVIANTPKSIPIIPEQPPVSQANKSPANPCKGISEIPETECLALVELYETTDGEKWKNKKNWLKTKQPCQWNGVVCVNNQVVTLKLDKNQLTGSMPNLSGLTALKILNLSRNNLSGGLPSFNALLELESLFLGNNKLTGRLPEISHLKLLRILELQKNQLTGNLPSLDSLTELEEINLSDNQFVGELPSLKKMNKLQKIALYNNQLTGNLPSFEQLVSLKSMHLSGNHLTGQIPDLSNLLQLESLNLSVNQLSGSLPMGLSKLVNLKWLQLESNQLSGKIPDLRDLQKLSILKLQNNQLCGEIPDGLRLSGLKQANGELQIENNHLTATNKGLLNFLETKIPNWQTTQKPQACE